MLLPHFLPCQQDVVSVRFFACTISMRAYPTALRCKISMRRCAELRRPTCFEVFCTCKFHECGGNQPVRVAAQRLQLSVYGRRSNRRLRALHQHTNMQRRLASQTAPALLVARPAPVESLHSWSHRGRFVVHERRSLRPLTLRCDCNSACDGRVAAPVYMPMQWNARENYRSVSASA